MVEAIIVEAYRDGRLVAHAHLAEGAALEVGRDGAGLRIDDPSLSGRHFSLRLVYGSLLLEDLGSTNGTYVNDRPAPHPVEVVPGGRILAGETMFLLRVEGNEGTIEGTRWRIVGMPAGMTAEPQFGFRGEQSADFNETVVCREEELAPDTPLSEYADRQFEQLEQIAPDLTRRDLQAPPEILPQEHVLSEVSFGFQERLLNQLHAYVRHDDRVGIAVWTFRERSDAHLERFGEILRSLRYG